MGIHADAQQGTLDKPALTRYLQSNPDILSELDASTGRTPLATAAVAGFADEVDLLLKRGAKPEALSRADETVLLLVNRETKKNRPRIVQLLLDKMPATSIDATTAADANNTPLMFAVLNGDVESIRLLVKAGASPTAPNSKGVSAQQMADRATDKAVKRAINPNEQSNIAKLTAVVGSFLQYIVAWRLFGYNPKFDKDIDEAVNYGETPNKAEFLENVDDFVQKNPVLERFFKGNPNYIQELAKKATELKDDPSTPLGQPDLLPKTIKVTLHQQVIYCDDSSSMKRDGRWEAQVRMVKKITQITTRVLPEGDGVALRFINQDVDNSEKLSLQDIGRIIDGMSWQRNGDTAIGTFLKSKILEPLVYSQLKAKPPTFKRPLLISVITDGMPSQESDDAFVDAIKECGDELSKAGYPRESVKFMIGQIGTAKSAAAFLKGVGENPAISDMVYVTSGSNPGLNTKQINWMKDCPSSRRTRGDIDRWLMETLFSPIKN
ncbi:putative ankyrin repeat protein [Favolaschia claudopus]|uniref:Ankyrin repeat protein n=1 Tax=Favolaschia claudopus TaxID=2862362 RepID=A0AAW0ASC5_9AGAR